MIEWLETYFAKTLRYLWWPTTVSS
jgi:hypothetical protein